MQKMKKRYLAGWGLIGLFFPVVMLLIGSYAPIGAQAPRVVVSLLSPMVLVVLWLSLVVTDAGGDSGALLPGLIISTIAILLNVGLYVGVGVVSWPLVERLFRRFRKTSQTQIN
jgi:hypothetical protein